MGAPPGCNITARLLVYDVRKQEGSRGWLPIHHVTLSAEKGLSREAERCFPFAEFTLERSEGLRASAHVLSMTELDLSVGEERSRSFEPCLICIIRIYNQNVRPKKNMKDCDIGFLRRFR